MTSEEMLEKLESAIAHIDDISNAMNDRAKECACCGLSVRDSMDDYVAKQALEAAAQRLSKLYSKLLDGWPGRELGLVVQARTLRGSP